MNIFEFLGVSSVLRKENKIFQYVKHFDDVNPKAHEGALHKKVKFPIYAQVKRDGVFAALVVIHGQVGLFNRTGKSMTNCSRLKEYFQGCNTPDGIYLGELLSRDCSLEQLSGVVNPNRNKPLEGDQVNIRNNLHIDFFDHVTINEFIDGYAGATFLERYARLHNLMCSRSTILDVHKINNLYELERFAKTAIELHNQEGAVFKQDVEWLAGAKDWHQMKKVRGIHVDLECIGWEEGTGKYEGHVANLLFRYKDDKVVKAMLGKGWTHEDASTMYEACITVESWDKYPLNMPSYPVGKIFHVYGLQESSKGIIRLPKVSEMRHDKTEPDF